MNINEWITLTFFIIVVVTLRSSFGEWLSLSISLNLSLPRPEKGPNLCEKCNTLRFHNFKFKFSAFYSDKHFLSRYLKRHVRSLLYLPWDVKCKAEPEDNPRNRQNRELKNNAALKSLLSACLALSLFSIDDFSSLSSTWLEVEPENGVGYLVGPLSLSLLQTP